MKNRFFFAVLAVVLSSQSALAANFEDLSLAEKIVSLKSRVQATKTNESFDREFNRDLFATITVGSPTYGYVIEGLSAVYEMIQEIEAQKGRSQMLEYSSMGSVALSAYKQTGNLEALRILQWLFARSESARRDHIASYNSGHMQAASEILKDTLYMGEERQIVNYLLVIIGEGLAPRNNGNSFVANFYIENRDILNLLPILQRLAASKELLIAARRPSSDPMSKLARILSTRLDAVLQYAHMDNRHNLYSFELNRAARLLSEEITTSSYYLKHLASSAQSNAVLFCSRLLN